MKFRIGDRVRVTTIDDTDNIQVGFCGTVIGYTNDERYCIRFDIFYEGLHGCCGMCETGHGWNCVEEQLELEYTSGKTPSEVDKFIKKTEEKKMPTKFTFYVKEGTRVDKTCNKLIPTMTTFVTIGRYHSGKATCDKADYDERQGCLEAVANAFLDGNFDREFNRAVKANEFADKKKCTCTYCGQVFDTVEEKQVHEAWHVERKKARRERYLLRKRAKQIAFEEAAQKMAKEMQNGDKK